MKRTSIILLMITAVAFACKKTDTQTSIFKRWEVDGFVEHMDSITQNPASKIYVEFKENKTYKVELEINACSGTFSKEDKKLILSELACTEACCDSDLSTKLLPLMSKVGDYYFVNEYLTLSGENKLSIRLKAAE